MKSSIVKNYIYNIGYQMLVLFLPLITTPYISRILGAEGIGAFGYTESISQYFILFGCIGLNLYVQREIAYCQGDKEERSKVFIELLIVRVITVSIVLIIFALTVCQSIKADSSFMELRTRQAPVPHDNIISPTLPTTDALAGRSASTIVFSSDLSAYLCHKISI